MPTNLSWRRFVIGTAALIAIALVVWLALEPAAPLATVGRADIELREGVLYRRVDKQPFSGLVIEEWRPGHRRAEVAVREGRAHGLSQGWYENGQREVEEFFVRGVSHGTRTRWYADGVEKSQVKIRDGQLVGVFREWHPNGKLARETSLQGGVPHGDARAWDTQGQPVGSAKVEHGRLVQRD
jgi:antitoxin component YwqK of YwqJK toxin-antitoxin module